MVDSATQRLYRLTFSASLAEMLARTLNEKMWAASRYNEPSRLLAASGFVVQRFQFVIGDRLGKNEVSPNGLYALMTKDFCLRISMHHDIAQMHSEDSTRYLAKIYLISS